MIDVVDFFCGCGGTSVGLRKAGMNIVAGIDFDAEAGLTFKRNFPDVRFINSNIRKLRTSRLDFIERDNRTTPLLFSACAPCQPFSGQKTTRKKTDDRASLLGEMHRFIRAYLPEYFFLENVPGLQNASDSKSPFSKFIRLLERLGYTYDYQILKSQDYGVPQFRRRLVLLASRNGDLKVPKKTHGKGTKNPEYESVWNSIRDLPRLKAGKTHPLVPNHRAADLSDLNLERIAATPRGGGRLDWPRKLKLDCHDSYKGHTDVYGRMHMKKPAAALTTKCISLSNGRYGHPTQNRAISVREAARLQTFPDNFVFEGSLQSMAAQIGNAVPVRIAEVFGRHINAHFVENRLK